MKIYINKIFMIIVLILSILTFSVNLILSNFIKLEGDSVVYLSLNEEYHESGAKISFSNSNDKIKVSNNIDNTKVGNYKVKYEYDILGFKVKSYRKVKVVDNVSPTIELNGSTEVMICPNSKYNEEGYTAIDNYDGDITSKVIVQEEDDVISYKVSDSSNNSFSINRNIIRNDLEAPIITLKGKSDYNIIIGEEFNDPGYEVSDNCDSDIEVSVSGSVDNTKAGIYEIVYTAKDAFGNEASVKRNIKVYEKESYNNNTGVIYLTFDDGPTPTSTPKILDILDKKGVKATFFVINHSSSSDYLIKREFDSGHTVALHSYTHDYKTVYSSKDAFYNDLKKISDKVYNITGEKSTIIRFPGGSSNTISRKYAKGIMTELTKEVLEKGYHYFDWNVDSMDAGGAKTSDDVYKNVVKNLKPNQSNVILMHDFSNNQKTIGALEAIIDYGLANGYRFDKIDITTPMVRHHVNN